MSQATTKAAEAEPEERKRPKPTTNGQRRAKRTAAKPPKAEPKQSGRVERVPASEVRELMARLELRRLDVQHAVERSPALIGGWLGQPGQIKDGRPTNPLLARERMPWLVQRLEAWSARQQPAKIEEEPAMAALRKRRSGSATGVARPLRRLLRDHDGGWSRGRPRRRRP